MSKEDIEGLESSIIELIAKNKIPKCSKFDLTIQDLLTDLEIKSLMRRKLIPESALTCSIDIDAEIENVIPNKGKQHKTIY